MKLKIYELVLSGMLACEASVVIAAPKTTDVKLDAAQDVSLNRSFDEAQKQIYSKNLCSIEKAKLDATEARIKSAFSKFFPKLDASYSYQQQDDGNNGSDSSRAAKVTVTQNVFSGFSDVSAKNSAMHASAAQKLRAEFRETLIKREISSAYFALAQAQAEMKVLDEVEDTIRKRYKDILSRIRIGKSRASEKTAVDAQISLLAAQREKAIAAYSAAQTEFAMWTGLRGNLNLTDATAAKRPPIPDAKLISSSLEGRKDLLALMEDTKSLEQSEKAIRGDYMPSVNVFGDYYIERSAPLDDVKWDVGVSISMPIFEGGITRAQSWEAAAKRQQSSLEFRNAAMEAATQLQIDYANARSLFAQADHYEKAAAASSKTYKDLNREYGLGLASNLEVLQALNTYLDHFRSLSQTHAQYLEAYWDLRIMAGQLQ